MRSFLFNREDNGREPLIGKQESGNAEAETVNEIAPEAQDDYY